MSQQNLCILGSTGSIGLSTLAVVSQVPEKYNIFALSAYHNIVLLLEQCQQYQPSYAVVVDKEKAKELRAQLLLLKSLTEVLDGESALSIVSAHHEVDVIMAAIVGAAGLPSIMSAAQAGKKILLANKEALVCAGAILMHQVQANGAQIIPVDSEHNAIFQCLSAPAQISCSRGNALLEDVEKIVLTASGGPFLNRSLDEFNDITPAMACAHPNWEMGQKISVDSATMMNKGLEFIEACWLFQVNKSKLEVVIHPQSIVHSLVEYIDGSQLAQLGVSDMKVAISYALSWPQRMVSSAPAFDLVKAQTLTFLEPDLQRFPCLNLAMECQAVGKNASLIMNAANEIAVEAFLLERIRFNQIYEIVAKVVENSQLSEPDDLTVVIEMDKLARLQAQSLVTDLLR